MSASLALSVNYNHQHLLKNGSFCTTSNQMFSSQIWRTHTQVNFRVMKTAAPLQAVPTSYTANIWGDHFLSYTSVDPVLAPNDMISHEKLKEEVRRMLIGCPNIPDTLEMIDAIQRLGVDYHFHMEIDQILANIMDKSKVSLDDDDLHMVSLKFRLLRQEGYNISCDVFDKFKNSSSKFKDAIVNDVKGLLSLYEATQLRTHGEEILDEALPFTIANLQSMATQSDSSLSNQIKSALEQPYYTGIPRLESRKYIPLYEGNASCNKSILSFAKLDFNLLQKLHQKEASEMARWKKESDYPKKVSFARDRTGECCLWAIAMYYEPEYSLARKMVGRVFQLVSSVDDLYDSLPPLQDLKLFTEAIGRWDISEVDKLPEYMKQLYKAIIGVYSFIEENMVKQGKLYRSYHAKEAMKEFVRGAFDQASWLHQKQIPKMDDYLRRILAPIGWRVVVAPALVGLGDNVTKHTFDWLFNDPNNLLIASSLRSRYMDHVVDIEYDRKQGLVLSSIDFHMKEYNWTEDEAVEELKKKVVDINKDINGQILKLRTFIPKPAITTFLNFNRGIHVIYENDDIYTNVGGAMKAFVSSLLVDPIPM